MEAFRNPDALRRFDAGLGAGDRFDRYPVLWSIWMGTWLSDPALRRAARRSPLLYRNTRQVWSVAASVVNVYGSLCYPGDLSTDGQPLPDGTRGAIPIDPQTGSDEGDAALMAAFAAAWDMGRMKRFKSMPVKTAAALGDCLVVLTDDVRSGTVVPEVVPPWQVADLDINAQGDVKRFTVEYRVTVPDGVFYGKRSKGESFLFRKEADGEAFRFFRDGQPSAFPEWGIDEAVIPNPYGFVPACWFRHEEVVATERGIGALDRTLTAMMELNSILSNALDSQHRHFRAPVGVIGMALGNKRVAATPSAAATDIDDDQRRAQATAESMDLLPLAQGGQFVTVPFDSAAAVALLTDVRESILSECPEAKFAQSLSQKDNLSGKALERIQQPVVGLVQGVRDSHDPQVIKVGQMQIAMVGMRLKNGDYPARVLAARPARYEPFRAFGLESYGQGALDCSLPTRDVFPEGKSERLADLLATESLQTAWALEQAGASEDDAGRIVRERREAAGSATDAFLRGFNRGGEG